MANSGRYRVEGLTREYEPGLDVIFAASLQRAPRRRPGITFLAPAIDSGACCTWRASRRLNWRLRMSTDCSIITVALPPSCAEARLEQARYHLGNSNERVANSKSKNAALRPPLRSAPGKACTVGYAGPAKD
jgi:hypothetical protein